MDNGPLLKLPAELLHTILAQLPVSSLLAFARTSRSSYVLATSVLTYLELAVFPKHIHCMLAFLEEECREDIESDDESNDEFLMNNAFKPHTSRKHRRSYTTLKETNRNHVLYRIGRATQLDTSRSASPMRITGHDMMTIRRSVSPAEVSPLSIRTTEFLSQNNLATTILDSRSIRFNVKSLTLHLYTLHTPALAEVLASLSVLQHLNLNFTHAYINDSTLPANYWRATPNQGSGSPIWNSLAGIGAEAASVLQLRNLRSLTLRRAGITAYQLRSWISANPHLQEIVLEKVRGVELEFVDWLAGYVAAQKSQSGQLDVLGTIILIDCSELKCQRAEDFNWIAKLGQLHQGATPTIKTLSVKGCRNVDNEIFCNLAGLSGFEGTGRVGHHSPSHAASGSTQHANSNMSPGLMGKWSQGIYRLVSPKGIVIIQGRQFLTMREKQKMGTRSPALTINEEIYESTTNLVLTHRKQIRHEQIIEVDPDLL